MHDRGVIPPAEVPADLLQAVTRQRAGQEHADLPRERDRAVALLRLQIRQAVQADEEVEEDEKYLGAATLAKLRSGEVVDEAGQPLSGVQVVIVNQQTGFQSGGLTQANGRYLVTGLRAGGPYRIEARMIGYGLEAQDDVMLDAGGTFEANFALLRAQGFGNCRR